MFARNQRPVSLLVTAALTLAGVIMGQSLSPHGLPVTYERLLKATQEPGNWLMYGGDYRSHHYSSLDQITVENVHRLRAKWIYQMHRPKVETTPIVVDGIMWADVPANWPSCPAATASIMCWTVRRANSYSPNPS